MSRYFPTKDNNYFWADSSEKYCPHCFGGWEPVEKSCPCCGADEYETVCGLCGGDLDFMSLVSVPCSAFMRKLNYWEKELLKSFDYDIMEKMTTTGLRDKISVSGLFRSA